MKRCLGLALLAFLLAAPAGTARAQTDLNVLGDNLLWDRGAAPLVSPTLNLGINRTSADPQLDLLAGWSLRLEIVPDVGATGTLEFNSRGLPSVDYVLSGVSGGLGGSLSGTDLFAFDEDVTTDGVVVSAIGENLLEIDFSTPDGALGLFRIFATPGLGDTQWSDASFTDQEFANLPFTGGPVEIGSVTAVPEPASLILCGLVSALGILYCWRKRHGGR